MSPAKYVALFVLVAITAAVASPVGTAKVEPSAKQVLPPMNSCLTNRSLEGIVRCLVLKGPTEGSDDYDEPTIAQRDFLRIMFRKLIVLARAKSLNKKSCLSFRVPVEANLPSYMITYYSNHCLLIERDLPIPTDPAHKGHGIFAVNAKAARELIFMVPHPLVNSNTDKQATLLFRLTGARALVVSGTHRYANDDSTSSCQPEYPNSDPAHDVTSLFHHSVYAADETYPSGDFTVVQMHAMNKTSCPGSDVYMTFGSDTAPGPTDSIAKMKSYLNAIGSVAVTVPGDTPSCSLTGKANTQGRFLNGVPKGSECGTEASSPSGRFIHIQQNVDLLLSTGYEGDLADAIMHAL